MAAAAARLETRPGARRRALWVGALLVIAAGAWIAVVSQAASSEDDHERMLTMGMAFPLFLGTWVLMMMAMMLPAASPMVDAFTRAQAVHQRANLPVVSPALFVAGYLLIWSSTGVAAFAVARLLEDAAMERDWLMEAGPRFAGALVVAAGVYQFTSLKRACLGKCRTPTSFIATSWKDGPGGAIQMGVKHGVVCLGCCWFLFVVLFPLGIMNVLAMVGVTLLVFAEKVLPRGERVALAAGGLLIAYGLLVLAVPDALPSLTSGESGSETDGGGMEAMDGM